MNEIDRWFDSGAEVNEGLRLLSIYAPNKWLAALVSRVPDRYGYLLQDKLRKYASGTKTAVTRSGHTFRENWPFLAEPDCPAELKVLAADKITAWNNQVEGHEELYACTTLDQCFESAKKVMENFIENRNIHSEFTYYKEHHSILGKHPVFAASRKMAEIRKLSPIGLMKKKKQLQDCIWRIGHDIASGEKPHLLIGREARLRAKESELASVNAMIDDYEKK